MTEKQPQLAAEASPSSELAELAEGDVEAAEARIQQISEIMRNDFRPAELIKKFAESNLPEDVKRRLIASLSRVREDGFDQKYEMLLGAYFTAVLETLENESSQANQNGARGGE
jgi:hypothetical protein